MVHLVGHAFEEGVAVVGLFAGRAAGVAGVADQVVQDLWLGEIFRLDELRVEFLDDVFQDAFGLALIEDGVVALEPDEVAMHAEDALGDAVEGAAPELAARDAGQVLDAFQHLAGGLVRERKEQNLVGRHALMQQVGHPVGQGPGLARTGTRQNERRTRRCGDRRILLWIEFGFEIDGREG